MQPARATELAKPNLVYAERAVPASACLQGGAVRKATATPAMRIDAVRRDYERTRREMESQAHRAARLDKKAAILVAGLQQRHAKLTGQLDEVAQQVRRAAVVDLGLLA